MYSFPYYKEKDKSRILDFVRDNPFAFLTGSDLSGNQVATQVPILIEEKEGKWFLQGHIMKNTDHHKVFSENPQALVVFSGPHTYVSASWYSSPGIASTWNYMSVHINGHLNFMSDADLVEFMRKLTLTFEGGNDQSPPFYDNLSDDFIDSMMPAIVGFELKVEKMDHVFKLSQNRDEESYRNIISQLNKQGGNSALIATEMQNRIIELFPPDVVTDPGKMDS